MKFGWLMLSGHFVVVHLPAQSEVAAVYSFSSPRPIQLLGVLVVGSDLDSVGDQESAFVSHLGRKELIPQGHVRKQVADSDCGIGRPRGGANG